jgi:hypothetical protein
MAKEIFSLPRGYNKFQGIISRGLTDIMQPQPFKGGLIVGLELSLLLARPF